MIDEKSEIKTIVFGPRNGKSLFRLYPELRDEPVFKNMAHDDLLFAWYIGIPNSPVDHEWTEKVRWQSAAAKCFTNKDKREKSGSFDVGEDVKIAIKKFESYSPEARSEAKQIIQKIFHNYQKLVDVNVDTAFLKTTTVGKGEDKQVVTETDWTAKNQYTNITSTISKALPDLVKQIEEGFGIQEHGKAEETMGNKSIDKYHQQKKETK